MMDNNCYELVLKNISQVRAPFQERYPYYMIIETHSSGNQSDANDAVMEFIDTIGEKVKVCLLI